MVRVEWKEGGWRRKKISYQDGHFMEPTDNMEISTYCIAMMFTTRNCTIKELLRWF